MACSCVIAMKITLTRNRQYGGSGKMRIYAHIIIQQIVTLSKYGHDALDICHP